MSKIVFVRHAESVWNRDKRFTGWADVDLTQAGEEATHEIGGMLRGMNVHFDKAYTSVLKRAIRTLWILLWELDRMWIPVERDWRLNEKSYGALQGEYKLEKRKEMGEKAFLAIRRGYVDHAPELEKDDPRHPIHDERYKELPEERLPATESLKDTVVRVSEFWNEEVVQDIADGKDVLISAHGNSFRALVKQLLEISDEDISRVEIPFALPVVFEFDAKGNMSEWYFLTDAGEKITDIFHFSKEKFGI